LGFAGITVDLQQNRATGTGYGTDTLSGLERIIGTAFGDTLTGDQGSNTFYGLGAVDTLDGAAGDDILDGGPGADSISGGAGIDAVSYLLARGVTVDLARGTASNAGGGNHDSLREIENVTGSMGSDTIVGDAQDNAIRGLDGEDNLAGAAGSDTLIGGSQRDVANGGEGNDACDAEEEIDCETEVPASSAAFGHLHRGAGVVVGLEQHRDPDLALVLRYADAEITELLVRHVLSMHL